MAFEILDTSIREGEQTAGVSLDVVEKVELAKLLDEFGVQYIEAGHPLVSPKIREAVERIAREGLKAEIVAHVRARKAEVDEAVDCGVSRVAVFLGSSDIHLKYKLGFTKEKAIETVSETVAHAAAKGVKVRFTPEDATRTEFSFLCSLCNAAIDAGADHISIADTLGISQPFDFESLISRIRENLKPCSIELHCHNDLGLAVANAIAGIRGGATVVHTTVNGLGERSGIVDMATFITAMRVLGYSGTERFRLDMLPEITALMERLSGIYLAPHHPVVGANSFSHKSGVHTDGVIKNPSTYEAYDPAIVGRRRTIIVDKFTGRRAVEKKLEEYNISLNEENLLKVVAEIKNLGDRTKKVHDTDILNIVEQVTGKSTVSVPNAVEAIVLVKTESHIYTTFVLKRMANFNGVLQVFEITGDHDISSVVRASTILDLNNVLEEIRSIRGVVATQTTIILKKYQKQ